MRANLQLLIFRHCEINQQNACENRCPGYQKCPGIALQFAAEWDGRTCRACGCELTTKIGMWGDETPSLMPRADSDIRQIDRHERALPHFVEAPSALGQLHIMGDEDKAETFSSVHLFEESYDFALGVFIEIAGRLVGEQ